jgi:hypothetical protein
LIAHPCAGHACDHCYTCDELGVCCGSVSAEQLVWLEAEHQLALTMAETQTATALSDLVQREAETCARELPLFVPPALPVAPALSTPNPRKEVVCHRLR